MTEAEYICKKATVQELVVKAKYLGKVVARLLLNMRYEYEGKIVLQTGSH